MKSTIKFLEDMLEAIDSIEAYKVPAFELFLKEEIAQDAIMFNLIILGEAANAIPQEYKEDHPDIPWSSIIGTRNIIAHGYDQIKLQIVWDIIEKDLEPLKVSIKKLLE